MEKQKKRKKIVLSSILLIIIILNVYTIFFIIERTNDKKETLNILQQINDKIEITEETIPTTTSKTEEENIKVMNLNLNDLKNINSDTVAYLKVNGTNINYPVVQSNNNDYYLKTKKFGFSWTIEII